MAPRTTSKDIKDRIPVLFHELGYGVKKICYILGIKKTLVYKTLSYVRNYGTTVNPFARLAGRHRKLTRDDMQAIMHMISSQNTLYIDEIQVKLWTERGVSVSLPTLFRTLRRMNLSSKSVTAQAIERNDLLRAAYINHIGLIAPDPDMLMFTDETSKDERTIHRRQAWSIVGTRAVSRQCFVRGKRYSLLPILTLDGIITHKIFEGLVTSELFIEFLREYVVSQIIAPFLGFKFI